MKQKSEETEEVDVSDCNDCTVRLVLVWQSSSCRRSLSDSLAMNGLQKVTANRRRTFFPLNLSYVLFVVAEGEPYRIAYLEVDENEGEKRVNQKRSRSAEKGNGRERMRREKKERGEVKSESEERSRRN